MSETGARQPLGIVCPGEGRAGVVGPREAVLTLCGEDAGSAVAIVGDRLLVGDLVCACLGIGGDECSILAEDEIGLCSDDRDVMFGEGGYITKPRDQRHTMWNAGCSAVRVIEAISPAGLVKSFAAWLTWRPKVSGPCAVRATFAHTGGLRCGEPRWLPGLIAATTSLRQDDRGLCPHNRKCKALWRCALSSGWSRTFVECLALIGVDYVVGVGGANIEDPYDAHLRSDIIAALATQEFSVAAMADGYSRSGVGLGVVTASSGGAALNLVTGVEDLLTSRMSVLALIGPTPTALDGHGSFQDSSGDNGSRTPNQCFPRCRCRVGGSSPRPVSRRPCRGRSPHRAPAVRQWCWCLGGFECVLGSVAGRIMADRRGNLV